MWRGWPDEPSRQCLVASGVPSVLAHKAASRQRRIVMTVCAGTKDWARSALQIKLAPKPIADHLDDFEPTGIVGSFLHDDHLPGITVRSHRNRHIRGPIADFFHFHPYGSLKLGGCLGWLVHSARSRQRVGLSAPCSVAPSASLAAWAAHLPGPQDGVQLLEWRRRSRRAHQPYRATGRPVSGSKRWLVRRVSIGCAASASPSCCLYVKDDTAKRFRDGGAPRERLICKTGAAPE